MAIVPIPPAKASVAALAFPASGAPVMRSMRCCWANVHGGGGADAAANSADSDADADEAEDIGDPLGRDAVGAMDKEEAEAGDDASAGNVEASEVEAAATASGGVARSSARCMSASSAT